MNMLQKIVFAVIVAAVSAQVAVAGQTFRQFVFEAWGPVACGERRDVVCPSATDVEDPVVRLGSPFVTSAAQTFSDYLAKGRFRQLCRGEDQAAAEFELDGKRLLLMANLTDEPAAMVLPGYVGVFHEFRGMKTFVFSAFATQLEIAVDLAPREVILATTDGRQDEVASFADTQYRIDRAEDARRLRNVRPLGQVPEEGVRLRFGVLADTHLMADDEVRDDLVRRAFRYMDERKADGVVICGDLTQNGSIDELRHLGALWDEVFPRSRRSDGGTIEKLFAYGDHDVESFTSGSPGLHRGLNRDPKAERAMRRRDIALNDRARQWKEAFHEDFAPVMRKTVKGYDFVLAHLYNDSEIEGLRYAEPLYIPGLEEFFETNRFDRTRPLFYVQHKLLKGTIGGPNMPGQDAGRTSAILRDFPNAVAFSGHKHRSARDERMLWQGAFTAVEVPGTTCVQTEAGYENGWSSADRSTSVPPRQMPHIDAYGDCAQGLFATVYDDRIVLERREFLHGGEVAEPWVVSLPNRGEAAYERRAQADRPLPRFAPSASVSVRERDGKDRDGKATRQIVVTCPTAPSDGPVPRAYAYEFQSVVTKCFVTRKALAKRVFSPKGYLAEAFDDGPVECVFALAEIPSDHDEVVFEVRPVDAFGRLGEPIVSKPRSFNPTPSCLYPF